jgi:sodium/potassium-transporting ATPase subunit alpha
MDTQLSDPEKAFNDIEAVTATRAVAFPDDANRRDEKLRPTGVELRREMTQEDIRLAAAGYDHLTKDKPSAEDSKFGDVDITEHSLPIHEVESFLSTSFNWLDPAQSRGLTSADAEARLKQNGPNALTPPKKKSALQKVGVYIFTLAIRLSKHSIVHRLPQVPVQHHLDRLGYS